MNFSSRMKHIVLAACAILAVAGIWIVVGHAKPESRPSGPETGARLVKARYLEAGAVTETRSYPGVAQSVREADLSFRVGGPLLSLDVRVGERVETGRIVARIDPRDFEIRVKRLSADVDEALASFQAMKAGARAEDIAALEAALDAATSQLSEAGTNFERYKKLYEEKAVARATYDSARTAYDTAKARVTEARTALAKGRRGARHEDITAMEARIDGLRTDLAAARLALADTELKAPFDGYVNVKYVENFETVSRGQPIISLLDTKEVEVRTSIPETLLARRDDWDGFSITFDSRPETRFPATLKEVGRKTEGPGQSFILVLRASMPPEQTVRPGTAANVDIRLKPAGDRDKGISVPASAVFADADGSPGVWKIIPETMTLIKVHVQTHGITGSQVRISGNLRPGDLIVTAGARFLRKGQNVRLMNMKDGGRA